MQTTCPPPRGFRDPGRISWAIPSTSPPFARRPRPTGRRAQGIRYERRAHAYLTERFGQRYVPSPWFSFSPLGDGGGTRWCQPDGLLFDIQKGRVTVLEIKYQHTADAWWQLTRLYLPVLRAALGNEWELLRCEVVKWYDPATLFPEAPVMTHRIENLGATEFGVHIWKP